MPAIVFHLQEICRAEDYSQVGYNTLFIEHGVTCVGNEAFVYVSAHHLETVEFLRTCLLEHIVPRCVYRQMRGQFDSRGKAV